MVKNTTTHRKKKKQNKTTNSDEIWTTHDRLSVLITDNLRYHLFKPGFEDIQNPRTMSIGMLASLIPVYRMNLNY